MVKQFDDRSDREKPERGVSQAGIAEEYLFGDYYFGNFTTANAVTSDPGWADASTGTANVLAYDEHNIYANKERKADKVYIKNDAALGGPTIFVRVAFSSTSNFSKEFPIYPGERWVPRNVFALRIRSPTAGTPYRVTELELGD